MTAAKKRAAWGGGITLAGIVLLASQWQSLWTGIEPTLTWGVKNLGIILEREQVQACLAATAAGQFFGVPLPHLLPSRWTPATTRLVSGFACAAVAFAIALALVPTRTGFVYAAIVAFASPTVSQLIGGLMYLVRPAAKPESLQP